MDERAPDDLLAKYPEIVEVPVQWGDQDAFGHVNNTIFLRWFEIGRIAYFREIGLAHDATSRKLGPILAAIQCTFERQMTFPDKVRVGSRVSRLGTSSAVVEHLVVSERHAAVVARGTSTMVFFDYAEGKSTPFPPEIRERIDRREGRNPA